MEKSVNLPHFKLLLIIDYVLQPGQHLHPPVHSSIKWSLTTDHHRLLRITSNQHVRCPSQQNHLMMRYEHLSRCRQLWKCELRSANFVFKWVVVFSSSFSHIVRTSINSSTHKNLWKTDDKLFNTGLDLFQMWHFYTQSSPLVVSSTILYELRTKDQSQTEHARCIDLTW